MKNNYALDITYLILKIIVVLLTIPLIFTMVGLIGSCIFIMYLMFRGIFLYGPLLFLLGSIVLNGTIINIIYTSLIRGDKK